ncbi:efflux transporter periplasmic adaptor subunit [Methylophaga sp. 42_25_T18]|nr:efflux transporter periplasmic adaptor subunit [Methylophaga sp. 42_25_T18]
MIKRVVLPFVILAIAIMVFMGLKNSKPEHKVMEKTEKIWRVDTLPVTFQQRAPEITIYGRVETPRVANLTSALIADVIKVNVLEGTEVNSGDVLVELDNTDAYLLLEQRQAELAEISATISSENVRFQRDQNLLENEKQLLHLADNAVVRAKKLEKARLASQATLDDAYAAKQRQYLTLKQLEHDIAEHPARLAQLQARKKRAQALLSLARVDLERCHIKAPFTGRISQLDITIGDRVREGDNLLSIYDLTNLEVRAQLPGRYITQLRTMMVDEQALLATADIDGSKLEFTLERFSGEVRQDSGGIDGLFRLTGNSQALALGTFVELRLKLAEQEQLVELPYNALYELDRVYLLQDGYLKAITIERIGEYKTDLGEKRLLVRSNDLQQGDHIVSTQLPNAITGLRVEAIND